VSPPLGSGSVDPTPYQGAGGADLFNVAQLRGAAPPNVASGRSSLILLDDVPTPRPLAYVGICSWRSNAGPLPVSVLVGVDSRLGVSSAAPYVTDRQVLSQLTGGALFAWVIVEGHPVPVPPLAGTLRLTYGIGSSIKILEADIRAGSYQLPPCDQANLDAFVFLSGPCNFDVLGGIVPGVLPTPSRFTASVRLRLEPAQSYSVPVPLGARWVAMAGGDPTGTGVGQPVLQAKQGASSVFLLHDYQTGSFLSQPGQPVEIFNREDVVVTNAGPAEAFVTIRFFLEV
jgi:hypothetical protein